MGGVKAALMIYTMEDMLEFYKQRIAALTNEVTLLRGEIEHKDKLIIKLKNRIDYDENN